MTDSDSYASCVTVEDPTRTCSKDVVLKFLRFPIKGIVPVGKSTIANWSFSKGSILSVHFYEKGGVSVTGSGVMVAPGVALCATHVFDEHIDSLMKGEISSYCQGITPEGAMMWKIREIVFDRSTDISVVSLELFSKLPSDNSFYTSIISTRTPNIDEELTIFGFRAEKLHLDTEKKSIEIESNLIVSKGKVIEIHELKRDNRHVKWPSIAIEATSFGAMSGGPVYDGDGFLVGLLAYSLDAIDGDISYAAQIWPIICKDFKGYWPNGVYHGKQSLIDIHHKNLCRIIKPESVERTANEDGTWRNRYSQWFK